MIGYMLTGALFFFGYALVITIEKYIDDLCVRVRDLEAKVNQQEGDK